MAKRSEEADKEQPPGQGRNVEYELDVDSGPDAVARRELLELSITAAGVGTFDWNLIEGSLVWDDRLIELFGYSSDSFDRSINGFNERLHPDDLERVSKDLRSAIGSCGEFESEYRVVLQGGAIRWIGAKGRVLCDEDGVAVRMLGAAWDNTARAEVETHVARVMESMTTAFFSLDSSWRFTYVNSEAENVLGRKREELIGGELWELFPASVGSEFETNYRHAMETGEHVAFDAYYPAPLDAWYEVRAWRVPDGIAVYFLEVTARHRAQVSAKRAAERTALLGRITNELAGTLILEEAAQRLTELVVPALADWCIVTLLDDAAAVGTRRGLGKAVAKHSEPAMQPLLDTYASSRLDVLSDDSIILRAMLTGEPQYVQSGASDAVQSMFEKGAVQHLMAQLAPDAIAVLPLSGRSGPVGMLSIGNGCARGSFDPEDVTTLTHVGARAGLVMENARLYRQQSELAEALQRLLLTDPPEPDHAEVQVRYLPASEAAQVGGDWYDVFLQPGGQTVLVIGDVVGHNAAAAAAMSQVRTLVRGVGALGDDGPAEMLRKVDRLMETLQVNTDATVVVMRMEQTPQELQQGVCRIRWSNAGHPPPMVIHEDATVESLVMPESDLFLGVFPESPRNEYEITLKRGSTVLLYTDGLVERRDQSLELGLKRLEQTLQELAQQSLESLVDDLLERMRPSESDDDVALVAVRMHPQDDVLEKQ